MPSISRRRFLRKASLGAAAAGVAAAGGTGIFKALGGLEGPNASTAGPAVAPAVAPSGILAHIDDADTGRISILVGTRKVNYVNRDLAQLLVRAAQ